MTYSPSIPDPSTSIDPEYPTGMLNVCCITGFEREDKDLVYHSEASVYVSRERIGEYVEGLEYLSSEEKEQLKKELYEQRNKI